MIGCSDNKNLGNEYIEGKDAQYMFMGSQDQNYIAMAENGYYFLNGIYIYYCDFNTMESVVLCNKPNCLHDKELDETKKYKLIKRVSINGTLSLYFKSIEEVIDEEKEKLKNSIVGLNETVDSLMLTVLDLIPQ